VLHDRLTAFRRDSRADGSFAKEHEGLLSRVEAAEWRRS
jgi:hypothetical protein